MSFVSSSKPWTCNSCTYVNSSNSTKCEMCDGPRSIDSSNRYQQIISSPNRYDGLKVLDASSPTYPSAHTTTSVNDSSKYSFSSPKKNPGFEQSFHQQDSLSGTWICEQCTFENDNTANCCSMCNDGQRPHAMNQMMPNNTSPQRLRLDSPKTELSVYPTVFEEKSRTKFDTTDSSIEEKRPTSSIYERNCILYIPDLPFDKSNTKLEQMIRSRLIDNHRVKVSNVICHPKIGVGIIYVSNEEDKDHLVKSLQSIILDPQTNTIIRFVEELELISYLVFDQKMKTIITPDDIARRWQQLCRSSHLPVCKIVAMQFPNIFRIVSHSIDELLAIQNVDLFATKDQFTQIYLNADCSFFEDLPHNITASQITIAINAQIAGQFDQSSLYVQYNKDASIAIVLTTNIVHKWTNINSINLNNQYCMKKKRLAFRLVIHPISSDIPTDTVTQHKQFQNTIIRSTRISDKLIIEVTDKSVYDTCVTVGAIRIKDQSLFIEPFTKIISDPDNMEINAESWYNTEMLDYQPELKQFLDNPQHPIFRYKWNAKSWLEQFHRHVGIQDDENDKQRRLLRVTVMLNTIGVLRKKCYSLGTYHNNKKEIKLNLERMKNIIYNHRSKLSNRKEVSTSLSPPFTSTIVKVVNEDCLVVYERLATEKTRPLLLNMANAQTPGGGYRKGAGAQEENLFRRSNYYLNLDMELDHNKQADRFWCTANCEQKLIETGQKIYPIEDYGAIYTSGITVFRDIEEKGYTYLDQPVYGVCAIASAAYARPELKRGNPNMLAEKYAVDTRKKIENIFAIAHHHGHDCLILSAFGCGAFRNPPTHIAMIFKSVIEQYAGYFKEIYFSIIDDHNTGNRLNPDGNYRPFKTILDGMVIKPSHHELDVNMISGPFRIISKTQGKLTIDQVKIFDTPPCRYGSLCNDLNDTQHCQTYSHPSLCVLYDSCDQSSKDEVHLSSFIHRSKCVHGGMCKLMKDDKHLRLNDHPGFCEDRGFCPNMEKSHLIKYRHVDLCRDGLKCLLYLKKNAEHSRSYRHCLSDCQFGDYCVNFHDQEHVKDHAHPFRTPCPLTPYVCKYHIEYLQAKKDSSSKIRREVDEHCNLYSHICPFGRQCRDKDGLHIYTSIHIARNICPDVDNCSKLTNEEHLNSFTHSHIHDIRYVCKYSNSECRERWNRDHMLHFRHTGNYPHIGIGHYSGLNKNTNFVRNQYEMTKTIRTYTDLHKWKPPSQDTFKEITEWIRALQPVHRCNRNIFESILVHGHVMSRKYMDMLRSAQFVANAVDQHPNVRKIFNQYATNTVLLSYGREFVRALVAIEFDKAYSSKGSFVDSAGVAGALHHSHANDEHNQTVRLRESQMKVYLKTDELNLIRKHAIKIAEASLKLHANPMGIGHGPDESFGTNNHVFSILGPNLGFYYGDIFIVFKHELMFHPDANFSIQAATTFGQSGNAYKQRPWLKDPGTPKDRIQHYHWTRLHCSVYGYENAAALELMALTGVKKKTMDVKLKDVQHRWMHIDPHEVFEGHLPQLIPLDYIDHIYMPKNVFNSLSSYAQTAAKDTFRHNLTITDHNVDLSAPPNHLDGTRSPYQKYVIDEINKKIGNNKLHSHRGTIITLPATNIKQYICIPITITQSFHQYQTTKKQSDNIFIYWQALGGDMILTLSKYQIESSKDQSNNPSLMCYIADIPSNPSIDDYRESYSYITTGHPFTHDMLVQNSTFKAKSNSFHRGCNIHDYITYCLTIKRTLGEVTLTHVGANSIYNHQIISYTFHRSELDLTKLDYIQISANNRIVPIRNLTIRHEPIKEYYPSFDKDFKEGSEPLVSSKKSTAAAASSTSSKDDQEEDDQSLWDYFKEKVFGKDDDDETLTPCRDSVNCLLQYSTDESKSHNKKYSHPCPYSELCRNKNDHPHLEHIPHLVPKCQYDKNCRNRGLPVHRAEYRHTDLPDFLVPCRSQGHCKDKTTEHSIKYSHGEKVLLSSTAHKSHSKDPTSAHHPARPASASGHKDGSASSKHPK